MAGGRARKRTNEHAAILVHEPDWAAVYDRTFWLSKHPEKSGSRAYFAVFPRICTVCEVYSKELGRTIRVFNTHFDHICGPARSLGVRTILEYMHRYNLREKMPTSSWGISTPARAAVRSGCWPKTGIPIPTSI